MTLRGLLTFVASVLAASSGAFAPWLAPFFGFRLISDYFQPELNALASLTVAVAFIATYAMFRRISARKKKSLMTGCLAGTVLCFFLCLLLTWTVGVTWAPGMAMTVVVRLLWIFIYLLMFLLLSIGLCGLVMLVPQKETQPTAPNNP